MDKKVSGWHDSGMNFRLYARRAAGTALSLAVLYTALGFLALPAIVKSQAVSQAATRLHRKLSIAKVDFNPFTLALSADGIALMEPDGKEVFFGSERVAVDLSWQSLWRLAPVIEELRVSKPSLHLVRDKAGRYNIDDILALIASTPASPQPARFSVNNIAIDGGRIAFDDQPTASLHRVDDLKLGIPSLSSMPAAVQVFVEPLLAARINGAPLLLKGKARPFAEPKDMAVDIRLSQVDLARYLAYLPYPAAFRLKGGALDAAITASFRQPREKGAALVLGGKLSLHNAALTDLAGKPMLKWTTLDVDLGSIDVFSGKFNLARIALDGLDATVVRDAKGQLNLDRLAGPPAPAAASGKTKPGAGLTLTLKDLQLTNAALRYSEPGMRSALGKLNVSLQGLAADTGNRTVTVEAIASDGAQLAVVRDKSGPLPARSAPAGQSAYAVGIAKVALQGWSLDVDDRSGAEPLAMSFQPLSLTLQDVSTAPGARMRLDLAGGAGKSGKLAARGTLGLAPLHAELALELDKVSLLPLQPYASESVNLRLTQALLSTKGSLRLEQGARGGLRGGFKGDASIDRLATTDKASSSDFVRWKSLSLAGMEMAVEPFAMSIDKVTLSDFFARVIIDPTGRINLQDVRRTAAGGERSLTDAGERAAAASAQAAQPPVPPQALPPIRINTLALSGGRVRFTDNFIRPNYSASLQELGGTVTGLSSAPGANASVALRGVVNSAPLSISGLINPLKRDLFLDVKAEVRGIELATLSAYADKYVGYGIDKGKLSFEVAYQLDQRQLKSDNRLILDQLTFGKESANPEANKLPVRLAVALLSDRNGIIDISVPVAGTLDDPQFSIGGIILKIIGNAIVKTVTSPFTLLASAFGGGDALSTLEFDAGRSAITVAAEGKLGALAKALTERPGLKLDIAGHADPLRDLEALRQVALERKVRAVKTRDLKQAGADLPPGGVVVGKDEYAALLVRAFQAETFNKPRNAIGMQKALPQAEMEQMIIANVQIGPDDLQALARRRSQAAKDWLMKRGQVPDERIYIVAAHDGEAGGKAPGARVDFALR